MGWDISWLWDMLKCKRVVSELKKYGTFITLNNMGICKYISFLLKLLSHVQLFATPWSIQSMASLQARILEWVACSFCRGSSQPRDWTQVSRIVGRFFTSWATRKAEEYWNGQPIHSPWDFPNQGVKLGSPAFQADWILYQLSYCIYLYFCVIMLKLTLLCINLRHIQAFVLESSEFSRQVAELWAWHFFSPSPWDSCSLCQQAPVPRILCNLSCFAPLYGTSIVLLLWVSFKVMFWNLACLKIILFDSCD